MIPAAPEGQPSMVSEPSIGRTSSLMAVASLVSRITGFVRSVLLFTVLGAGVVNDSYTVSNTLPVIVYELLLGGVLSSVMVPLLVRAQGEDDDGGEAYTRRLMTIGGVSLLAATGVAIVAAPLLTRLYLGGSTIANADLATAFAYLLLPQIFFYGVGALVGAVLNSRNAFGAFAWAPVANNVVVLAVLVVYFAMPGEISLDPVRMGDPKLLVLGLGTTLGIIVQAIVLVPAMRTVGFRYRPLWGWDPRLTKAGGLALWALAYVIVGLPGYMITTQVAAAATKGSIAIYNAAWLVLQVPYGVLGVSLLTALMPRMSRAAAEGRLDDVVSDLSLGSRLSAIFLVPISVLITVFGTATGIALFGLRGSNLDSAVLLGATVAFSAFGLLPYAITLLQLRVYYALTDSRTPTWIQLFSLIIRIPMLLLCPVLLRPEDVVLGLAAANGLSFIAGAALGQFLLHRRLGHVRTGEVLSTVGRTLLASLIGMFVVRALVQLLSGPLGQLPPLASAWIQLIAAVVIGGPIIVVVMRLLRVQELTPLIGRLERLVDRGKARRGGPG
ncbi:murein biosynthesis integral membrane protein MurJ [Pseudonocardia sp. GCM10023141]|uniref:murein biosynthesis integral membrane protein MurJ n=1 Tax=Pseudonocardia sp. GCM10023141 TaxID=3252653 RepID=UPI0036225966